MTDTPHLGMPLIAASQSQKHVTHNQAIVILDAIVQLSVIDSVHTAPPVSPAEGDRYRVASGATGVWSGWDLNIALFTDGAWEKLVQKKGWTCYDENDDTLTVWNGSAWTDFAFITATKASDGTLTKIGINTAADDMNRLAVKSSAILLSHEDVSPADGNIRISINKSSSSDDASLIFEDGFSSRALMGLLGDDNFSIKVSADGASFIQAISIDKSTGHVGLGTSADGTNALSVSGGNALFTNGSGSVNIVLSKHASGDDASLTMQSNFSSRLLFGLLGDDNLTVKVSTDGSSFTSGIIVHADSARVSLEEHPKFSALLNFGQNYAAGSFLDLLFNNFEHDDQNDAAISSNVLTFTAPHDGYYLFGLNATYETTGGTAPTKMQVGLSKNGAAPSGDTLGTAGDAAITDGKTQAQVTTLLKLAKNDTVKPKIFFTTNNGRVKANENYFWGCQIA